MLSVEQQELLSAMYDGELTAPELALANALLRRDEARGYLQSLIKLRVLVARHARAAVPADFAAGVIKALEGDYGDISRPVGRLKPAAVHTMPVRFSPWLAAAAAVVVAAGLFIGSALFAPPQGANQPMLGLRTPPATAAPDKDVNLPAEETRGVSDAPEKPGDPAFPKASPGPGGAPDPAPPRPSSADEPQNGPNDGTKAPPAVGPAPERKKAELRIEGGDVVLHLHVNRANDSPNLQIYNDVLRVGALYGYARLATGDEHASSGGRDYHKNQGDSLGVNDFSADDHVTVEVADENVADFLEALGRLAREQSYGSLVLPQDIRKDVRESAELRDELARIHESARAEEPDKQPKEDSQLWKRAQNVLPLQVRAKTLETEIAHVNRFAAADLARLADARLKERENATKAGATEKRRIVIRLR